MISKHMFEQNPILTKENIFKQNKNKRIPQQAKNQREY